LKKFLNGDAAGGQRWMWRDQACSYFWKHVNRLGPNKFIVTCLPYRVGLAKSQPISHVNNTYWPYTLQADTIPKFLLSWLSLD